MNKKQQQPTPMHFPIDECAKCTVRGDMGGCLATRCSLHESWYARTQHHRITELESQLAQRFDAADVATAAAQGFRDGATAPAQPVAEPAKPIGYLNPKVLGPDGKIDAHGVLTYSSMPCGSWTFPFYAAAPTAAAQPGAEQAKSADMSDEREAFEAWLRSVWTAGYGCQKCGSGKYVHGEAQRFWECWQARASHGQAPAGAGEPFGYFHQLLNHEGKGNGVWLGAAERKVVEQAHTPGETSEEIVALYTTPQPTRPDPAYSEACNLATALFKKHFAHLPDFASGQAVWSLCDSTAGVISQIDNMVAGLVQPPTTSPQTAQPAPPPVARVQLTPERVKEIVRGAGYDQCGIPDTERAAFINGLRHGEQAHSIKKRDPHVE